MAQSSSDVNNKSISLDTRLHSPTFPKFPTRKESEVFGCSRIPHNTGSRSRIFCPIPTPDVQLDHFLHHTPKLGIPVEMVQFLLKLLLKQRFLAVHHDFH